MNGSKNVLGTLGYSQQEISAVPWGESRSNQFLLTGYSLEAARTVLWRFRDSYWGGMSIKISNRTLEQELADSAPLRIRSTQSLCLNRDESRLVSDSGRCLPPSMTSNLPGSADDMLVEVKKRLNTLYGQRAIVDPTSLPAASTSASTTAADFTSPLPTTAPISLAPTSTVNTESVQNAPVEL